MIGLVGKLADKTQRAKVSKQLAKELGAEELIIFIKDAELDVLLPAAGFLQTLQESSAWQAFLKKCINQPFFTDELPFPSKTAPKKAVGIAYNDACIVVLLGGKPAGAKLTALCSLLPLINSVLQHDQYERDMKSKISLAEKSIQENQEIVKKLGATRRALQAALEQKNEFIGVASHELKTPLTSIKAYSQVLERRFLIRKDTESAESMARINVQLDNLTGLVGDLLDVTKIEAGKLHFNMRSFDYDSLVAETVENIQLTSDRHTIIIKGLAEVQMMGDRERIGQVLINLMSNAIKYSPQSKKIVVQVDANKEYITTSVQDYGIGISKDKQEQVFEQFFRVSGPNMESFPGLGLGLYISAEIVKRQGGKIWVEGAEGKGSTFCFKLPRNTLGDTHQP